MRDDVDTAALERAAEQEVRNGLTACQVAAARDNEVFWTRSVGSATADTRFWVASATKPIFSSAIWLSATASSSSGARLPITRPSSPPTGSKT